MHARSLVRPPPHATVARRPSGSAAGQRAGNQRPISRAADSSESEPCTRFWVTLRPQSRPRSPRIVPGAAVGRVGGAGERPEALDDAVALGDDGEHRAGAA